MSKKIEEWTKEELQEIINSSQTMDEVARKIGYTSYSTSAWKIINQTLNKYNIQKIKYEKTNNLVGKSDEEVFCEKSTVSQQCLKGHFKKIHPMDFCAICRLPTEWNGKPLTLRLDHINGIHNDNRLENLRWVCPNCDSQLDTYCGRNQKDKKIHYYCIDCGVEITGKALRCVKCDHKLQRKVADRPSKEELKEMIRTIPFTEIGRRFNVADNTIRKWCIAYNLPKTKREILNYTDLEWEQL